MCKVRLKVFGSWAPSAKMVPLGLFILQNCMMIFSLCEMKKGGGVDWHEY